MAAALVDDSIILKMVVTAMNTIASSLVVTQIGEPQRDSGGVTVSVQKLHVRPQDRVMSDAQEDVADVEIEFHAVVGPIEGEGAIDTITRVGMALSVVVNEVRLSDASTNHELVLGRCEREHMSDQDEDSVFGLIVLTARGYARRTSGATLVSL